MKAITYHYVQEYNSELLNLNFLHINDFIKQLDFLLLNYYFPSQKEFTDYIYYNKALPKESIILTFDDGLKCHYKYVLPELIKRNLWGIFYINSKPYINNDLLNVHKLHIILSINDPEIVYNYLETIINENNYKKYLKNFSENDLYKNNSNVSRDQNYSKKIKILFNYQIPYNKQDKIIELLSKKLNIDYNQYYNNYYLTISNIKQMHEQGMIIGNHTHNHLVLSNLEKNIQYKEIYQTYEFINKIIPYNIKSVCIPYGNKNTYNENTIDILKETKTLFCFTTEAGDNDVSTNKLLLNRYDCNKFEYGSIYKKNHNISISFS